jgi:hypothetical protein
MEVKVSMSRLLSLALCLGLAQQLTGCTYTNAVSLTNIPADRTRPIEASVKKNIFLGFNFDNDFALKLANELKEKCPNGEVKGVLTKDKTTLYFLFIFWARETEAKGFCIPSKTVAHGSAGVNEGIEVSKWDAPGDIKE